MASRATISEPVQAYLDDASDASFDPREVAAASGDPSLMNMFSLEDQSRAEQAVVELEQIETAVEADEGDGVSDARSAFSDRKKDLIAMSMMFVLYVVQPRGLLFF